MNVMSISSLERPLTTSSVLYCLRHAGRWRYVRALDLVYPVRYQCGHDIARHSSTPSSRKHVLTCD